MSPALDFWPPASGPWPPASGSWPPAPDLIRDDIRVSHDGFDYLGHLVSPPANVGLAIDLYGARMPAGEREFPVEQPEKIAVRGGLNLSGVVSFHGLLQTGEDASPASAGVQRPPLKRCSNQYNQKTIVQIENGADDHLVPDDSMKRFFTEMDDAGVPWIFHHHAATPHGFALPPTLGPPGRLHPATDRRSTMSMLNLFREIFPDVAQNPVSPNAAGTPIPV